MKYSYLLFLLFLLPSLSFTQNTYIAPENGNLSIQDCSGILYDSGGANAEYTNDNVAYITISGTSGDALSFTFSMFDVENFFDNLTIYDGPTINSPVIGSYTGTTLPNNGDPIILSGMVGLIVFDSDFIITRDGFEMSFECIDYSEPPVADISYQSFTCSGTVAFADESTQFPDSWNWDFGDGNTSTDQNPAYTYTNPGTYDIQLIACNDNGCDTTMVASAVNFDPNASGCSNVVNMIYQETDSTTACNGILYDNGGSTGTYQEGSIDALYIAPPGATSITLTFLDFDLGINQGDILHIYDPTDYSYTTLASYSGNTLPNNGQPITFNVSELYLSFYSDHFDNFDGFEIIWEASGNPLPPTADIGIESSIVPLLTQVQFTDLSTDYPGEWYWDFGDGNTSTEQNPVHVYTQPGTYDVILTTSNCNGSTTSTPTTITVQDPPSISINPSSLTVNIQPSEILTETITICNQGQGDLVSNFTTSNDGTLGAYYLEFMATNVDADGFTIQILNANSEIVAESAPYTNPGTYYFDVLEGIPTNGTYTIVVQGNSNESVFIDYISIYDYTTWDILYDVFYQEIQYGQTFPLQAPTVAPNLSIDWMSIDSQAIILANDCEDVLVTFNSDSLLADTYEGNIEIMTNDPSQPSIIVPVTLIVGANPALGISSNNLDFGVLQVGANSTLDLVLENTGNADLNISGLTSSNPNFTVQSTDNITLSPFGTQTISIDFAPITIGSYSEIITLTNNAGVDMSVTLTGTGIASPTASVNPTNFTLELISGQDSTLTVDISNIGDAELIYNISTSTNSTGFTFNFTTDIWGFEFSWNLLDSNGNVVQSAAQGTYMSNTDYSINIENLSSSETYTLELLDSWGDGALNDYSILDLSTGQVLQAGSFTEGSSQLVTIGSPSIEFSTISPSSGTLQINESGQLSIDVDATALPTGVYYLNYDINTNDPTQPVITVSVTLYVVALVEADIDVQTEFICGNESVQFMDASSNVPTSWSWNLGDGTTSTEQNPIHIYASSGTYTVSLIVCNSLGCDSIEYVNLINVDLDCSPINMPQAGNEIYTDCTGAIYDSGGINGDYNEGSSSSITIAPQGATSVSITFYEFNFETNDDFLYIYDGEADPTNLIGSYTGNELEGQTITSSTGVITILENTDHYVNLSGFIASFSCYISETPPQAAFSILSDTVCINEPVSFIDQSSNYVETSFWDFGDGMTSAELNPFHQYASSGIYTVTLTVCNPYGCTTIIQDVDIMIDANCETDSNIPFEGQQYIYGCSGTIYDSGGPDENYPDYSTGALTIISPDGPITLEFITFDYENIFDELIVIDGANLNDPVLGVFTGSDLPPNITSTGNAITIIEDTDFTINESGLQINYSCQNATVASREIVTINDEICDGVRTFNVSNDTDIISWEWDFGDGTTSNEATPLHEFPHKGDYNISLTICDDNDCYTLQTMIYSNKLTPMIIAPDIVELGEEVHLHGMTDDATHWSWDFGNGEISDHNAPITTYQESGWHDIHVHLINNDIHETCDASHIHPIYVESNTTSLTNSSSKEISVYPNPTTSNINIAGLEGITEEYNVNIFSMTGELVISKLMVNTLSLENLPSGVYILEVTTENKLLGRTRVTKQ